jgi:cysteine desulfurase family protein (TIGR01976 family)
MKKNIRQHFPSLSRKVNDAQVIYLDGPAGTQVPENVIQAINHSYWKSNANTHGQFITSQETDNMLNRTRKKLAQFLGASDADTISFGQNMTSLSFALSYAFGEVFQAGDEILITQLDHEANRGPWLELVKQGVAVREVRLKPDGCLDYEDLEKKITERTRLLAIGYASNIFGTINNISLARKLTHKVGAWLLVDAVHAAPHKIIDVEALGCDFLLCSAYKFYGPHIGILYSRPGILDRLRPFRLRTANQRAPFSIETGTLNHPAIAGVEAAIEFIASLGEGSSLREQLRSAYQLIIRHEKQLALQLYNGLQKIPGVQVIGPSFEMGDRAPTLAFTMPHHTPVEVCKHLANYGIFAWDGHFYAIRATEVMGLLEKGGVTRMGIVIYNTEEEVARTLHFLGKL